MWYSGDVTSQRSAEAIASRWISCPGARTRAGVSTSRKPSASNHARAARTTRDRASRAARRPARRARSSISVASGAREALDVLARARVDLDDVAHVDEQRHVDLRARADLGGLARARR